MTAAPSHHDEHDLNLSSGHTQEIALETALALDPEQVAPSEDRKLNAATEAADCPALELHIDLTSGYICVTRATDSFRVISSELCASAHVEHDRSSIAEFSATEIFRHSPLGDVLNSLKIYP